MAKEITAAVTLAVKTALGVTVDRSDSKQIDMTGSHVTHNVQDVGTSNEAIAEGADLGTPGWYYLKNLDTGNYVEIGITGSYTIKLKPGEFCLFRATAAIFGRANTATCKVEYIVIEE